MNTQTTTLGALTISRLDPDDVAGVLARCDLQEAAQPVDWPDVRFSRRSTLADLDFPYPGSRAEHVIARIDGPESTVVAIGMIDLPVLDNTETAILEVTVHPDHRRQGIGRRVAEHLMDRAREQGRKRVIAETRTRLLTGEPGPGVAFLESLGLREALGEVRRRLHVDSLDTARLGALRDDAESASPGYHVVGWARVAPDRLVEGIATLEQRMSTDTPLGDLEWEPEHYDSARWRAVEVQAIGKGRETTGCAIVETATGTVAGYTIMCVDPDVPHHAWQWTTIVLPDHRGRRLGLRVKLAALDRLLQRWPDLRTIDTWNAADNSHMIAVNEAMGFEVRDTWAEFQANLG